MSKVKNFWECVECGYEQLKWTGSCTQCKNWNSFIEKKKFDLEDTKYSFKKEPSKSVSFQKANFSTPDRDLLKWKELNRLLGGGLVKGSLILLAGDPGIGKSTLILQICDQLAASKKRILYVCGEESVNQTLLRAQRLQIQQGEIYFLNETIFEQIQQEVERIKPDILVLDSIQVLYKHRIPSSPGSPLQLREIGTECMYLAKGNQITTFIIGHVTKSGDIAGPKMLEHLVDVVLDFEGDRQHGFRLIRSIKNRFGPTDDLAVFQMKEEGLKEVLNPSQLFLQQSKAQVAGSCITSTLQGTRPFLIEVQALVSHTAFAVPTRKCSGFDQNRLILLLAVLEKRLKYRLYQSDIFVSIAGGMKIKEPGVDLALLLAVASSFTNQFTQKESIAIGEVGLGGEIRAVSRIESRIKEAVNLGFKKCILPEANFKEISKSFFEQIEIIPVKHVNEAIHTLVKQGLG